MEAIPIEFYSEGDCVRGRFFAAYESPEAISEADTLVLVPGLPGNTEDVLGLGATLSAQGINVLMFNPRGTHASQGLCSFRNTLADVGTAWEWVQTRLKIDAARLALGGWSYGGGMAVAYAAGDPSVRRIVSVAGTDHAALIREVQRNPTLSAFLREALSEMVEPQGLVRGDLDSWLREIAEHPDIYGLRENASRLADRSILLIGGWEDIQITIDQFLLPLYRALRTMGARDVTFLTYHDGHNFKKVRTQMSLDIRNWLLHYRLHEGDDQVEATVSSLSPDSAEPVAAR